MATAGRIWLPATSGLRPKWPLGGEAADVAGLQKRAIRVRWMPGVVGEAILVYAESRDNAVPDALWPLGFLNQIRTAEQTHTTHPHRSAMATN